MAHQRVPRDRHGNPVVRGPDDCAPATLLWQDETALVVNKPSGMLVHNAAFAGHREYTLLDALRGLLTQPSGEAPALHAVHRLDRGTSGAVVIARSAQWTAPWQAALQQGQRAYLALVRGHLTQPVDVDHPVKNDRGERVAAQSRFVPLACSPVERCSVVRVELQTGRFRQIRQHAKHLSHPILGDAEYGKGPLNRDYAARFGLERLALHGWQLTAYHPQTALPWQISAQVPADLAEPLALLGLWPISPMNPLPQSCV